MTLAFDQHTLPFRTNGVVAGTEFQVSTNSMEVLKSVAQRRTAKKRAGSCSFEMEIIVEPTLDHTPRHSTYFRGMRHLVFAILPPRNFITYDLMRKRVQAVLSPDAASDPAFWNTLFLPISIGVLGPSVGVVPLHCACVDYEGNGILVAGISGAGKSTLAAALAQRGMPLVSDDWTYLSKQHTLVGHGLSSPLKLLPDTVRFFPGLRDFTPRLALNGETAYLLDAVREMNFPVKNICYPRNIFFLERNSTPGCEFVRCRPEYVRHFFENNAERLPEELSDAKRLRSTILQMLSSCPAWILRSGESPQETAAAIEKFLSEANRAAV